MTRLAMVAMRHGGRAVAEAWDVGRDETRRLPAAGPGLEVAVEAGQAVVTQAGHAEDHVLRAGQAVRLAGPGLGVVWALEASRVVIRRAAAAAGDPERPLAA